MYSILKFLSICLLMVILMFGCRPSPVEKGDNARDFTLKDIDGNEITLSQYRGKFVLVFFWADCCADFGTAFPAVQKAYEKLQSDKFELLAVNAGQYKIIVDYYADKFDITFPMLVDERAEVAMLYRIRTVPMNFLISGEGKVIDVLHGWPTEEYLRKFIY